MGHCSTWHIRVLFLYSGIRFSYDKILLRDRLILRTWTCDLKNGLTNEQEYLKWAGVCTIHLISYMFRYQHNCYPSRLCATVQATSFPLIGGRSDNVKTASRAIKCVYLDWPHNFLNTINLSSLVPRGDQTSGSQSFTGSLQVVSKIKQKGDEMKDTYETCFFSPPLVPCISASLTSISWSSWSHVACDVKGTVPKF